MGLFGTTVKDILKWENQEQVDKILNALKNKDIKTKDAAAASLVSLIRKWEGNGNVKKIADIFSIENISVKKAAINALGNFRITEAIPLFISLLKHPDSSIREEAMNSILKSGPSSEKYLNTSWNEINVAVTKAIEDNMINLASSGGSLTNEVRKKVTDHICSQVRPIKKSILSIFEKLNLNNPPSCFIDALSDLDLEVKTSAIVIIGNSKYFNLIYYLQAELLNEPKNVNQRNLENAISKLESQKSIANNIAISKLNEEVLNNAIHSKDSSILLRILQIISDTYQIERVVKTLGELKAIESVGPLINLLNHPSPGIKKQAAVSLGQIGDQRAVEMLIQNLRCKDDGVIIATVDALGKIGDKGVSPPLIQVFYAESKYVAERVVNSLILLQEFENLDLLMSTCDDAEKKIMIAKAIGKNNDKAIDILKNLLLDERVGIMVASARALVEIGEADYQVIERLQKALMKDTGKTDKENIAECLVYIAQKDFNLIRQSWSSIKNYIAQNTHHDNTRYAYSDCPSDSGTHTDVGILKLKLPANL